MVETNSGWVSDAPSVGGEGDSSLRSGNGGDDKGGSDSANNTVGSVDESAPTSSSQDSGQDTDSGREADQRLRPPRHPTPHPRKIAGRRLPSRYFPGGAGANWSGWKNYPS